MIKKKKKTINDLKNFIHFSAIAWYSQMVRPSTEVKEMAMANNILAQAIKDYLKRKKVHKL